MQWCISQENIKHSYNMLYILILLILIITTSVCVTQILFKSEWVRHNSQLTRFDASSLKPVTDLCALCRGVHFDALSQE